MSLYNFQEPAGVQGFSARAEATTAISMAVQGLTSPSYQSGQVAVGEGDILVLVHLVSSTSTTGLGTPNTVGNAWTLSANQALAVASGQSGKQKPMRMRLWQKVITAADQNASSTYTITNTFTADQVLVATIVPRYWRDPSENTLTVSAVVSGAGKWIEPTLTVPDLSAKLRDNVMLYEYRAFYNYDRYPDKGTVSATQESYPVESTIYYNGSYGDSTWFKPDYDVQANVNPSPQDTGGRYETTLDKKGRRSITWWTGGVAANVLRNTANTQDTNRRVDSFGVSYFVRPVFGDGLAHGFPQRNNDGTNASTANAQFISVLLMMKPVSFRTPTLTPGIDALTDTFATIDTAKWTTTGNPSIVNGRLSLPAGARLTSKAIGTFRNRAVVVELPDLTMSSAADVTFIQIGSAVNSRANIVQFYTSYQNSQTVMAFAMSDQGIVTIYGFAYYKPAEHKWLRMREENGTIVFDLSADKITWTTRYSGGHAFQADQLDDCQIVLATSSKSTKTYTWDNLGASVEPETYTVPTAQSLAYMGITPQNSANYAGTDVLVAILDEGTTAEMRAAKNITLVDRTYTGNVAPSLLLDRPDLEIYPNTVGHGNLVAACGVPYGGRMLDVCIINGPGMGASDSAMCAGIRWAAEKGAKVLNISFGGGPPSQVYVDTFFYIKNNFDVQIFIAAGNSGVEGIQYPAAYGDTVQFQDFVHPIAAFDERTDKKASFTNYSFAMHGVAPGVTVGGLSPAGRRMTWNGTSAASPHSALICAMLLTGGRTNPATAYRAMRATRRNTGSPDTEQGGGAWYFANAATFLNSLDVELATAVEIDEAHALDTDTELNPAIEATQAGEIGVVDEIRGVLEAELTVRELDYPYGLSIAIEREAAPPVDVRTDRRYTRFAPIERGGARVIAQSMLTGQFLHWDLPVLDLSITERLSGPSMITGRLDPDTPIIAGVPLTPWGTWIHVEDETGLIRASGILATPFGVSGSTRSLEVIGVTGFLQSISYTGAYSATGVDPLSVTRMLWQYAQNFPKSNLGVIVSGDTSNVRIGGKPPAAGSTVTGPRIDIRDAGAQEDTSTTDTAGRTVTSTDFKPYTLNWWEHTIIGTEIDSLAANTPFDYYERSEWNAARTGVNHYVDLRYPRAGQRRTDLRFADGENIRDSIPIAERDDAYVTDIVVFGAGEGADMIVGVATDRSLPQCRRVATITEKTIKSPDRATQVAKAELQRRRQPRGMEKVLIDARHENAPIGTFQVGDDIYIQTEVDWLGEINMWHRILDWTYTPDEEAVSLTVAPSSTFRYGSDA